MPVLTKGATPAKGVKTPKAAPAPAPAPLPTLAQLLPFKAKESKEPPTVMPDLRGCNIRQVLDLLNRTGLNCRVEGSGIAVTQEPSPGTAIIPGATCSVKFQSSS
jgi:hypothetical protein